MSIIQTVEESSKITNFEYFTVLIQEFAVKIEQGFIVAILAFMAADNVSQLSRKHFPINSNLVCFSC